MKIKSMISKTKNKIMKNIKKMLTMRKSVMYLSFGENCLTDDILSRYNIKSFSTPYSSGRSNIEYILQIEKDGFKDFLNTDYMKYDYASGKKVVRLTKYNKIENTYNDTCMNGFEFTHHDVLGDASVRDIICKRYKRLLNLKRKKVCILYHNRYGGNTDENLLIKNLLELKEIYEKRCKAVNIIAFKQIIVSNKEDRKVEHKNVNGIHIYTFYTLDPWTGDDQQIFWAKCDDDLIKNMICDIKKLYK